MQGSLVLDVLKLVRDPLWYLSRDTIKAECTEAVWLKAHMQLRVEVQNKTQEIIWEIRHATRRPTFEREI